MEEFSTARLPQRAKVDYWNRVHSTIFSDADIVPGNLKGFDARIVREAFGTLSLNRITSAPVQIRRTEAHLTPKGYGRFHLIQAVSGSFRFCQGGQEILVGKGDFTLSNVSLPSVIRIEHDCTALVMTLPGEFVRRRMPYPERMAGLHMSGRDGLGKMASFMVRCLWDQLQAGPLGEVEQKVAGSLIDVVSAAYTAQYGEDMVGTAVTDVRRIQIRCFIEANLRDPELTPGRVAEVFRISRRYVRMLFAQDGETVSSYILRRRLEECAHQMRDAAWQGRTITEIAFDWGFSSTAHFSRVFKEQYGVSPRQFREAHAILEPA